MARSLPNPTIPAFRTLLRFLASAPSPSSFCSSFPPASAGLGFVASAPENGQTPPSTLYLEGTAISTNANVTLTYTWAGQSVSQVRKLVVLGEGFDSQLVAGCDLYLIPYVDDKPHFGPVCKDQRVTFKVVDCRTEEEPTDPPAPCTCPAGLSESYGIVGYYDGLLASCSECDEYSTTAWDGTFHGSNCSWQASTWPLEYSIGGKSLFGPSTEIRLDTSASPNCKWTVAVTCQDTATNTYLIWQGEKATGDTPAGTYNRTGGCDTTSTLEIEAVFDPQPCPEDCTDCADEYVVQFSGMTEAMNGTYAFSKSAGSHCTWDGPYPDDPGGSGGDGLWCYNGYWRLACFEDSYDFVGLHEFRKEADGSGCPPSGTYQPYNGTTGTATVSPAGSSSGPDPAHENNATVTELIVNGGSNVSGTSASTERTATASTPGENQLSANATVEWNGETYTKTAQLTVVEITGIEYSQDGGSTWTKLPKDEPPDGDFVRGAATELETAFRLSTSPEEFDGSAHSLVNWDLGIAEAGWLTQPSGMATTFVYDHLSPYISGDLADVKIEAVSCSGLRPASFTFITLYAGSVLLLENSLAQEEVEVRLKGKAVPRSFNVNELLREKFLSLTKVGGFKPRWERQLDFKNSIYQPDHRNKVLVRVQAGDAPNEGSGDSVLKSLFVRLKQEHRVLGNSYLIGYETQAGSVGEYYYVPHQIAPSIKFSYDDKSNLVLDSESRFRGKDYYRFVVARFELDVVDSKENNVIKTYLPGSDSSGPKLATQKGLFWADLVKDASFQPQLLRLKISPIDTVPQIDWELNSSQEPGFCINATVPTLAAGKGNDSDFSFARNKNKSKEAVVLGQAVKGVPSGGISCSKDDVSGGKIAARTGWVYLWCKDYGGVCTVTLASLGKSDLKVGKIYDSKGKIVIASTVQQKIPIDNDDDHIADAWETAMIREWDSYYSVTKFPPRESLLDGLAERIKVPIPRPILPLESEFGVVFDDWSKYIEYADYIDIDIEDFAGYQEGGKRKWHDAEPRDPDGPGPLSKHGVLLKKDYSGVGDGLSSFNEYRGYVLDGGGRQFLTRGHIRLKPYIKEHLFEVDSFRKARSGDLAGSPHIRNTSTTGLKPFLEKVLRLSAEYLADEEEGIGIRRYYVLDNLDVKISAPRTLLPNADLAKGNYWSLAEANKHALLGKTKDFDHLLFASSCYDLHAVDHVDPTRRKGPNGLAFTDIRANLVLVDTIHFFRTARMGIPLVQATASTCSHEAHHLHVLPSTLKGIGDDKGHISDADGDGDVTFMDNTYFLHNYNYLSSLGKLERRGFLKLDATEVGAPTGIVITANNNITLDIKGWPEQLDVIPSDGYLSFGGREVVRYDSYDPETGRMKIIRRAIALSQRHTTIPLGYKRVTVFFMWGTGEPLFHRFGPETAKRIELKR